MVSPPRTVKSKAASLVSFNAAAALPAERRWFGRQVRRSPGPRSLAMPIRRQEPPSQALSVQGGVRPDDARRLLSKRAQALTDRVPSSIDLPIELQRPHGGQPAVCFWVQLVALVSKGHEF